MSSSCPSSSSGRSSFGSSMKKPLDSIACCVFPPSVKTVATMTNLSLTPKRGMSEEGRQMGTKKSTQPHPTALAGSCESVAWLCERKSANVLAENSFQYRRLPWNQSITPTSKRSIAVCVTTRPCRSSAHRQWLEGCRRKVGGPSVETQEEAITYLTIHSMGASARTRRLPVATDITAVVARLRHCAESGKSAA